MTPDKVIEWDRAAWASALQEFWEKGGILTDLHRMHILQLARADKQEQCAKVAEDGDHVVDGRGYYDQLGDANATARNIAAAIRALKD